MAYPNIPFLIHKSGEIYYDEHTTLHAQLVRQFKVNETEVIKAEFDFESRQILYPSVPFPLTPLLQKTCEAFVIKTIPTGRHLLEWFKKSLKKIDPKLIKILNEQGLNHYEKLIEPIVHQYDQKEMDLKKQWDTQKIPEALQMTLWQKEEDLKDQKLFQCFLETFQHTQYRLQQWMSE